MPKSREEELHNKGAQDRSEYEKDGKSKHYEPPHGLLDQFTTWDKENMERHARENEAYDKGWKNTGDQIKGKKWFFLKYPFIKHFNDGTIESETV